MQSLRPVAFLLATLAFSLPARAADRMAIDAAVKKGSDYLEGHYRDLKPAGEGGGEGIGPAAISGLALLESGKGADNVAVKAIAAAVREASYTETRTYQLALGLLFLDRLGEKSDEPRIQLLAVRLLAGQNSNGGWTYACIESVPAAEEQRRDAAKGARLNDRCARDFAQGVRHSRNSARAEVVAEKNGDGLRKSCSGSRDFSRRNDDGSKLRRVLGLGSGTDTRSQGKRARGKDEQ